VRWSQEAIAMGGAKTVFKMIQMFAPMVLVMLSSSLSVHASVDASKLYPGARIELTSPIQWGRSVAPAQFSQIKIRGEGSGGTLSFSVLGGQYQSLAEGVVSFSAWMPARVAVRRVAPGQALNEDSFKRQEIDVAVGMAREYRGVIVSPEESLNRFEAKQTILENQPLISNAYQRIADVRRGDAVRVRILSNGLELSTQGIAQEPAYTHGSLKVMTGKAKREVVGRLSADGSVEVQL
jgi:flagella basal body P-ring formation protein FlgA